MARREKFTKSIPIQSLVHLLKAGKVELQPDYQRDSIWTNYQRKLLIDSILREYDIPKIYLRRIEQGKVEYEVVDGQQRLQAIHDFLDNKLKLLDDAEEVKSLKVAGKKFDELPTELQLDLQSATLDVVHLVSYTEDDVEDMFIRLQSGTPLNAPEKRRAYPGSMRHVVRDVAQDSFFALCGFGNRRGGHEDAVAKALHILLRGEYTDVKPRSVERTYLENQTIDATHSVVKRYKRALSFLNDAFAGLEVKFAKYEALTLPILVDELLREYDVKEAKAAFSKAYVEFETRRLENRNLADDQKDPILFEYTQNARNDSITAMEARHRTLKREFLKLAPRLAPLDPQRFFDEDQRFVIFHRDAGTCRNCKKKVSPPDWHADHIVAHATGGKTTVENGQVLCPECNAKKAAAPAKKPTAG